MLAEASSLARSCGFLSLTQSAPQALNTSSPKNFNTLYLCYLARSYELTTRALNVTQLVLFVSQPRCMRVDLTLGALFRCALPLPPFVDAPSSALPLVSRAFD